jgi:DNA-binding MurR/RpiR family transcriptional regulator
LERFRPDREPEGREAAVSPAPVEQRILGSINALTPAETQVARAILASYPSSATRSSSAIARNAGTSPASVVRFVAKLGFTSLNDFHEAVRGELDARSRSPFETVRPASEGSLIESVIDAEAANISTTLRRITPETLEAVRAHIMDASTVAVLGGRFSHAMAVYLHAHLRLIRPAAVLLSPANVPDQIAHAGRGTCLVAFDFRRYHGEAEFAAGYVKERRGRVIVITDPYVSPAAHHADVTLIAEIEGPHVVDSYAAVVTLLDTIIGDLVSADPRTRRRIERVEAARSLLDAADAPRPG